MKSVFHTRKKSSVKFFSTEKFSLNFVIAYIAKRLTVSLPRSYRSIWFHGETIEQFTAAKKVINQIKRKAFQYRFVFTSRNMFTYEWLRSKFSNDEVLPSPNNLPVATYRFFTHLRPKIVIILGSDFEMGHRSFLYFKKFKIPLIAINISFTNTSDCELMAKKITALELYYICVKDFYSLELLKQYKVPEEKISISGSLQYDGMMYTSQEKILYLKNEIGILQSSNVIVAKDVDPQEESAVLKAFVDFSKVFYDSVFLFELRNRSNLKSIKKRIADSGLSGKFISERSKEVRVPSVIVFDIQGKLQELLPIADAIIAGGTFHGHNHNIDTLSLFLYEKPVIFGRILKNDRGLGEMLAIKNLAIKTSISNISRILTDIAEKTDKYKISSDILKSIISVHIGASEKTFKTIENLIPSLPEESPVKQGWRVRTLRDRVGHSYLWKLLSAYRKNGRIDNWEELKKRLGNPKTILCLGNGPSSEDPRINKVSYDCLFRVNWIWQRRGILLDPDLVIVGDPKTVYKVKSCIFGFLNEEMETGMLLRHLITRGPRRIEYVTLERISPIVRSERWKSRPTSGALMLVIAAALQPERIIIGGIDLYLHPFGAYPGDMIRDNNYAQVHDMKTDVAIMRSALAKFSGEVTIYSDELHDKLSLD